MIKFWDLPPQRKLTLRIQESFCGSLNQKILLTKNKWTSKPARTWNYIALPKGLKASTTWPWNPSLRGDKFFYLQEIEGKKGFRSLGIFALNFTYFGRGFWKHWGINVCSRLFCLLFYLQTSVLWSEISKSLCQLSLVCLLRWQPIHCFKI